MMSIPIWYKFTSCVIKTISRLEQEEMYKLYTEIEMPLIYSLWHMEQEGVLVKRDKLKEYGDTLKVGIKKLETESFY